MGKKRRSKAEDDGRQLARHFIGRALQVLGTAVGNAAEKVFWDVVQDLVDDGKLNGSAAGMGPRAKGKAKKG